MKEDSSSVLNCLFISNSTVQRNSDEIALGVEQTLIAELEHANLQFRWTIRLIALLTFLWPI